MQKTIKPMQQLARTGNTRQRLTTVCISWLLLLAGCSDPHTGSRYAAVESPLAQPDTEWRHYLGDSAFTHYSSLQQIDVTNVGQLQEVWRYRAGGELPHGGSQMTCNPLIVKAILYCTGPDLSVFALDAATGKELWRTATDDSFSRHGINTLRGLSYWEDKTQNENQSPQRLLMTAGGHLYALDARTGQPIADFGDNGRVSLHTGLPDWASDSLVVTTTPGTVYGDLLILGSRVSEFKGAAPGHIRAFDIRSGALRWTFRTIPAAGEFGAETWPSASLERAGGANAWAGLAVDQKRGMVFAPTGSASFDFYGGDRHGDNLFANSLVALDANNGERLWHYQFVRHDVWDRDLPSPPNLITVQRDGSSIDAVAQATKSGHVFVFDRDSGQPLFPIEEITVTGTPLPGESLAASQPLPTAPPPFTRQQFAASTRDAATVAYLQQKLSTFPPHQPFQAPDTGGTIIYPGIDGGAEWGGMAWDPQSSLLFVNANEVPFQLALTELPEGQGDGIEVAYMMLCSGCHGGDLAGDGVGIPSLRDLGDRLSPLEALRVVREGRGRMPAFTQLKWYEQAATLWYVYNWDANDVVPSHGTDQDDTATTHDRSRNYLNAGYQRLLDQDGLPASEPPWGTLTAIDVDNNRIAWRTPLGDYPAATQLGLSGLGAENYGGPIVTAGGLLFIAATPDAQFRAFDSGTGQLLWQTRLDTAGYATPATYAVNGRQFVVIAAGGGKLGTASGSEYIAFALPTTDHNTTTTVAH
ncbi:pyrroloquinoline quinone-dependent dehydrogenase [Halieaceae bacterium IMCC14734]|uniref:Pyrroloquinoline quinone-dependent dehydrogenase n=1 Tax=Candidatus Litorirhabdus singularis TaxID=2518993 RepID=A0ABT3TI01_9GAMM|nr:PQQ-binding-like beta-propeller repeat protein [Candidatus Litorirhabdus singularis]MCX2981957.1 pyrroloquinoline quinone-dependent dehydrogenase [Candidatus Litorirhabdus singularis]